MYIIKLLEKLFSPLVSFFEKKLKIKEHNKIKEKEYHNKLDAITLKKIKKLLYESGTIQVLKDHDFGAAYFSNVLKPIDEYIYEIDYNPEFKFLNSDLDKLKEQLDANIKKFSRLLIKNSFPSEIRSDIAGVPKEWRYERPEHHKEIVDTINCYATQINKIYIELIQTARKNQIDF